MRFSLAGIATLYSTPPPQGFAGNGMDIAG
ncbi:hypothetical protein P3T22_002054 [Paraburkholderia sp. GAS348]